jgi:hypothetical protein
MTLRLLASAALLVAIAFDWRPALLVLLAWQTIDLLRLRRELFAQQEADVLRRLSEYWRELTK